MIEFVTLVSRTGDHLDQAILEPLTAPHPRGSHILTTDTAIRSEHDGRRLTLLRTGAPGSAFISTEAGWAVFDGIAVHAAPDGAGLDVKGLIAGALGPRATVEDIERLAGDLRGDFTICASLPDGALVVVTDPLGTYPVFVATTPSMHLVSNNALLVEAALSATPHHASRSAVALGIEAVFGTSALESTGYDNVRLVPGSDLVVVTKDGALDSRGTAAYQKRYRAGDDADTLLDRAVREVTENVAALTAAPFETRVADLTGGVDSRLVLAAIMAQGAEGRYGYFCAGSHPAPDYSTSAFLQDVYGLQEARGWMPQELLPFAAYPVPAMRHLLYRTMGCYAHYFLSGVGSPYDSDLLRLHGGLGETFRSFYSLGFTGDDAEAAATHLLATRHWEVRRRYLTPAFAEWWEKTLRASFADRCGTGTSAVDALDQWYIEHRNRYHFGLTWRARLLQYASFHPLYSPAAVAAAFAMTPAERSANRVGFEMMRRLYEPLAMLPFAEKSWSRSLTDPLVDAPLYRQLRPFTPGSPVVEFTPGRRSAPRPTPRPRSSTKMPARQDGRSAWARQQARRGQPGWWITFDAVLPAAREYVRDLAPSSPMWEVFARSRVLRLLDRSLGPDWTGREIQIVYKLFAAGVWLSGDEAPSAAGQPI